MRGCNYSKMMIKVIRIPPSDMDKENPQKNARYGAMEGASCIACRKWWYTNNVKAK